MAWGKRWARVLPDARNISAINDFPFCTMFGSFRAQQEGRTRTFSYSVRCGKKSMIALSDAVCHDQKESLFLAAISLLSQSLDRWMQNRWFCRSESNWSKVSFFMSVTRLWQQWYPMGMTAPESHKESRCQSSPWQHLFELIAKVDWSSRNP